MLIANFRVAMLNRITLASYYTPSVPDQSGWEWLIVERAGPVLTISDATAPARGSETEAPADLSANNTLASVLIETSTRRDTFLFMRHLPPPAESEGNFFPADGYAVLGLNQAGNLKLSAHGRHSLLSELRGGKPIFIDVPIPPESFSGARTWHFNATQKPWSQETI